MSRPTLLRLGSDPLARPRSLVGGRRGGSVVEMDAADDGWWTPGGGRSADRGHDDTDYGFLLDDDPHAAARPAVAAPAGRASTSSRAPTTLAPSPGRTRPGPGASCPGSVLYELHVGTFTPRGHARQCRREARPPALDRRRPGRADAGQRLQRHRQLGLRRGRLVRRQRGVRRPAGVPALRRRLPCRRAGRRAGRRLQPPRSVGELPAAVRALPQGRAATPGATWSTSTARVRRRCAAFILDNARMWFEDYHVDALRLDAVHALHDGSPVHLLEELATETRQLSGRAGPAADADRGVRPQRRPSGHAARRTAATASMPSGATTSTTPSTSR